MVKEGLKELQDDFRDRDLYSVADIVQAGIEKIEDYQYRIDEVPAYRLALCKAENLLTFQMLTSCHKQC
jgi:hypothetical protein